MRTSVDDGVGAKVLLFLVFHVQADAGDWSMIKLALHVSAD